MRIGNEIYVVKTASYGREKMQGGEIRYLVFMDIEAAELLLLPFPGDGKRAGGEFSKQSSHHSSDPKHD